MKQKEKEAEKETKEKNEKKWRKTKNNGGLGRQNALAIKRMG